MTWLICVSVFSYVITVSFLKSKYAVIFSGVYNVGFGAFIIFVVGRGLNYREFGFKFIIWLK